MDTDKAARKSVFLGFHLWFQKTVYVIPSILLIAVAVHQIYLAKVDQLSPWKGGGFGMFSSTELGASRFVRIFVSAPDRSEELEIPESLADPAQRAAILPSHTVLQDLAAQVVRREQRKERPVDTVRVEVWRTQFERTTLKPETQKIRDEIFQADRIVD